MSRALTALVPGSQLSEPGTWQLTAPYQRDIHLNGRGLILLPTFHWTGMPLAADLPGQPALLAYPAGPGLPVPLPDGPAKIAACSSSARPDRMFSTCSPTSTPPAR